MPTITLDDLNTRIRERYEPLTIDLGEAGEVVLLQALVLPKEQRKKLTETQKQFNDLRKKGQAVAPLSPDDKKAAWEERAAALGVEVPANAKKSTIITAVEDAEAARAEDAEVDIEAESIALMQKMFSVLAKDGSPLAALFAAFDGELVKYMELMKEYQAAAKLGEASASPS